MRHIVSANNSSGVHSNDFLRIGGDPSHIVLRERCIEKKSKEKLTSVSFMYVCVAENAELLVFFLLFFAPSP